MRRFFPLALLLACSKSPAPAPVEPTAVPSPSPPPQAASVAPVASSAAPKVETPPGPPKNLNVLVISIDSMRTDMPWNGYPRPIAPRLTALEKKAVSYTRSYAVSSYTSMSIGGFLAGRLPSELGRSGYFFGEYSKDNLFFPKLLQKAKVHTMGVQAHFYFKAAGFEQGFDNWEIVPNLKVDNTTDRNVTAPESEALMEKVLSDPANDTGPFFAWVHFLDPHDVYMPHEGYSFGRSERDKYDGEIAFTDHYVGKLLDFVATKPWASRTAIVITSDHGEAFGEHGQTRHGFAVWDNLVHVPLFFVVPGAAPKHIDEPRSALDLAPTILEFLGVPPEPSFVGTSLVREVYGDKPTPRDVYVDLPATSDNDKHRALIRGNSKLICYSDQHCKLFDLASDPGEERPITRGDTYKELVDAYRAHAKSLKEVAPSRCGVGCLNNAYKTRKK